MGTTSSTTSTTTSTTTSSTTSSMTTGLSRTMTSSIGTEETVPSAWTLIGLAGAVVMCLAGVILHSLRRKRLRGSEVEDDNRGDTARSPDEVRVQVEDEFAKAGPADLVEEACRGCSEHPRRVVVAL